MALLWKLQDVQEMNKVRKTNSTGFICGEYLEGKKTPMFFLFDKSGHELSGLSHENQEQHHLNNKAKVLHGTLLLVFKSEKKKPNTLCQCQLHNQSWLL